MGNMQEKDLTGLIRRRCAELGLHALGLTGYRIPGASAGGAGYPDFTIAGPGGILFRECKSDDGRRSMAQIRWGKAITAAGGDYDTWRPDDWQSGRINNELRAIAGTP